jgi:uncharacterized protein YxeA
MKKVLIAVLALGFMAVTSGLVLADGTTPAAAAPKHHVKHHKKAKKSSTKPADSTSAPASTPAAK